MILVDYWVDLVDYFKKGRETNNRIRKIWRRIENSPYHKVPLGKLLEKIAVDSDGGIRCCSRKLPKSVSNEIFFKGISVEDCSREICETLGLRGRIEFDEVSARYYVEDCGCFKI